MDDLISREAVKKRIWDLLIPQDVDDIPSAFEGMTNGEVIMTIYPNETMFEQTEACTYYGNMRFDTSWWNAPYKGVSK